MVRGLSAQPLNLMDKLGEPLLYIVRHAEVESDAKGKIRGLLNDGLNDTGEQQAKDLAEFFSDRPISAVYTDDLKRTYHTGLAIAHEKDLEVKTDINLRSWDVGSDLEGRKIEAKEDEIKELKLQPDKVPVGGMSWREFESQAIKSFNRYIDLALSASAPIVLVLHGSGIQVIWDYLGELEKQPNYDSTPLENGGVAAIYASRSGYRIKVFRGEMMLTGMYRKEYSDA